MNRTIESVNKVIPSMHQDYDLDSVALVADRVYACSMASGRGAATSTIGASKRNVVVHNQPYFASAPLRRRLDDGKALRIAPLPVLSQEDLTQEVFAIIGDSTLTTSKTTVSPRRGSSRSPRQVRELLKDNGHSLDLYLQYYCNTTEDDDTDAESDIDE